MHRPEPDFRTNTFIAGLCLDADGEMQLAAGDGIFELRFAEDESPEALRRVRIEDDDDGLGPWQSPTPDGR